MEDRMETKFIGYVFSDLEQFNNAIIKLKEVLKTLEFKTIYYTDAESKPTIMKDGTFGLLWISDMGNTIFLDILKKYYGEPKEFLSDRDFERENENYNE
jgi:hypothetical protein